ncbi:hypothetical protein SFRURICE_002841 [Spodoptera frugiperda]|nr:hypothetical protein SFRURICE_002841 [Spodoptera frugiperda]
MFKPRNSALAEQQILVFQKLQFTLVMLVRDYPTWCSALPDISWVKPNTKGFVFRSFCYILLKKNNDVD